MKKLLLVLSVLVLSIIGIGNVYADEATSQDNTYKIIYDDSGSGFAGNSTRSEDQSGENILIGGFEPFDTGYGNTTSGYKLKTGLQATFEANVAEVDTLSNLDSTVELYNRLLFIIQPNGNPTTADGVKFAVQVSPDNTFANYHYVNPMNFQLDAVTNTDLSTYYSPCAQTTSNPADDTRWDCGTVPGLKRFIKGLAPNTQYCARIVAMNGDATNSEPGPNICATTLNLTMTFTITPNSSNFGLLSANQVTTAIPSTTLTSNTNAEHGYNVYVTGTGSSSGGTSALYKFDAPTHSILSTSGNLDASIGAEGYGLQGNVSSGNASLDGAWDPTIGGRNGTFVGQILRTPALLYSRTDSNQADDEITTTYLANIATSTPAGIYKDTLIFTMMGNW